MGFDRATSNEAGTRVANRVEIIDLTCERGSVDQIEGLLIPRSSVRFRLKT